MIGDGVTYSSLLWLLGSKIINAKKFGFIGYGRHAKANLYPSLGLCGVNLHSVCTKHIVNANLAVRKYGTDNARAYDNYREMLKNEQLDAVFVVLPEQIQTSVVIECLKSGVHVFVEKPLGLSVIEAENVAKVSEKTKRHVMVGFMNRYSPAYIKTKEIISDGSIGKVLSFTGMYAVRPFKDLDFFLKNISIHFIDLIHFLFGSIVKVVTFENNQSSNVSICMIFKLKSGQIGNVFLSSSKAWSRHYEEVVITGHQGFIKVENKRNLVWHITDDNRQSETPEWQTLEEMDHKITSIKTSGSGGWADLFLDGYVGEIQHFIESISRDTIPSPSAHDNVRTMKLIMELLESCRH